MNASSIRVLALVLSLAATGLAAQPALRAPLSSLSVIFGDCAGFAGLGPLALPRKFKIMSRRASRPPALGRGRPAWSRPMLGIGCSQSILWTNRAP